MAGFQIKMNLEQSTKALAIINYCSQPRGVNKSPINYKLIAFNKSNI